MENQTKNPVRKVTKLEIVILAAGIISFLATLNLFLFFRWTPHVPKIIFRGIGVALGVLGLILGGLSIKSFKPVVSLTATTAISLMISFIVSFVLAIVVGLFTGGLLDIASLMGASILGTKEKENKDIENVSKLIKIGMQLCALGIFFTIIDLLIF